MTAGKRKYHADEARRLKFELTNLDGKYAENGIVKTILRKRIEQEKKKSKGILA